MITSDRDVYVGSHHTLENRERLRAEAARRRISMSLLVSLIVEKWLDKHSNEELDPAVRSNKRAPQIIIRAVPGHTHVLDADGRPTCGCKFEEDVPLPFDSSCNCAGLSEKDCPIHGSAHVGGK